MIIKGGYLIDPKSGLEGYYDIEIQNNKIIKVGADLIAVSPPPQGSAKKSSDENDTEIINAKGLVVAPGLIDVHVHFREPGFTHKEDIQTGAKAAAKGGFTTVICMANTKPVVDNVDTLRYILEEGKKSDIHVLSAASVTKDLKGKEMVDMEELYRHGACTFTDDGIPLMDEQLAVKAMKQSKELNAPISFHEEDSAFITNNGINWGKVSEELGIGGSPSIAEDIMVARDCMLALHTGACVNIQHISSRNAVELVRTAKKLGANVISEATPHHFTLTEDAVLKHGALAKMNPPLRTTVDREAIIEGLIDGTIDVIVTDHAPHSIMEKEKPLTEAPSGIIGLETSLALGITNLVKAGRLTLIELMRKMSYNPAELYHLDGGTIEVGAPADIVIFAPDEIWAVENKFASKSCNTPFVGEKLYGKVKYTICDGRIVYNLEG